MMEIANLSPILHLTFQAFLQPCSPQDVYSHCSSLILFSLLAILLIERWRALREC